MLKPIYFLGWTLPILLLSLVSTKTDAHETGEIQHQQRTQQFKKMERLVGVPWYDLAAVDQYERHTKHVDPPKKKPTKNVFSIQIPASKWTGVLNPDPEDIHPGSIQYFNGMGRDANGDHRADLHDEMDVLYSLALFLAKEGTQEYQIRQQLWNYYQHPTAVDVIVHISKIYQKFQTMELDERAFPLPSRYDYSYKDTWGARRSWGGSRIHEGTDLFTHYGTPVLSTCYGYVELIGWNRFGGWRIGIRDTRNNYHYFAHLRNFRPGLKKGALVTPGEPIGAVGSSGYGPPGTSGKFPPHLHYGVYTFNGYTTYSYNPYPFLKKWERERSQKAKKEKRG